MTILTIAFLTALAFFILMMKMGIRKFTNHSVLTDVIISGGLTIMFVGTFTGMATALTAGIFISLMLAISKAFINLFSKKQDDVEYIDEPYAEDMKWD